MSNKRIQESIVLSVSVGKGCYRHIQISVNETLEELADIILWAFDFYNDHAHAFFMNNQPWTNADCFYMAEVDEEEKYRHTCDYTLHQLNLQKNDKFLFLFDFGDEWRFQCRVLRTDNKDIDKATIVRMVGESPEQYPDYDYDYEYE